MYYAKHLWHYYHEIVQVLYYNDYCIYYWEVWPCIYPARLCMGLESTTNMMIKIKFTPRTFLNVWHIKSACPVSTTAKLNAMMQYNRYGGYRVLASHSFYKPMMASRVAMLYNHAQ